VGAIVDPVSGTEAHDQTILIDNGVIREVGSGVAVPREARAIDLSAEWLAPGLMDAHQHLSLGMVYEARQPYPDVAVYLTESTAHRALRGIHNAQIMLNGGFTTIRDPGYEGDYAMVDVRRAIKEGYFDGPTIISGGKVIAPFGGNAPHVPSEQGPFWNYEYIDADTPDDIRRAVRRNLYYGANVIKLVAEKDPESDQIGYHYSKAEIRAAVDEAHKAGIAVAIHVFGGAAAQAAIDAGVDSIEHGWDLSDAQLAQMKAKGIFLCGTEIPREQLTGWLGPREADAMAKKFVDRLNEWPASFSVTRQLSSCEDTESTSVPSTSNIIAHGCIVAPWSLTSFRSGRFAGSGVRSHCVCGEGTPLTQRGISAIGGVFDRLPLHLSIDLRAHEHHHARDVEPHQ
jgi:imidazolonepropionase-like amidohydrolase